MAQLINNAQVLGDYLGDEVTAATEYIVELTALSLTKTADRDLWVDDTPLSYTLRINNIDPSDPVQPVTNIVLTDVIDPRIAVLDTTSVQVDGQQLTPITDFTYDPVTGKLEITSITEVIKGTEVVVTFQVTKVPTP